MQTRTCTKCLKTLRITEFYSKGRGRPLPDARCKQCVLAHKHQRCLERSNRLAHKSRRNRSSGYIERLCTGCQTVKPVANFSIESEGNGTTRMRSRCKDCVRQRRRRYRARIHGAAIIEHVDDRVIIARDGSSCYLCHRELTAFEITLDHVIPLARGGFHTVDNLRVACRRCNRKKSNYLLSELDLTTFTPLVVN